MSEPNGQFHSENLTSNEMVFARVVPDLAARTSPGGVYLGVGPEQNFTYIAAMRPQIAIIADVRRGNLQLQLMYKALFELSSDRADFVSRLFSKKRPDGLNAQTSAYAMMTAYWNTWTSDNASYTANLQAIDDELTKRHHLPLDDDDLSGIARVYHAFYWYGPAITYSASTTPRALPPVNTGVTYADLVSQTDGTGQGLSFLGSEDRFRIVKDLESKNLVLPVVGNFGGAKALRAVGDYVRQHGATIGAFYVSNVEQYLKTDGIWPVFCANVATMPLDDKSVFIRPGSSSVVISSSTRQANGSFSYVAPSSIPSRAATRSALVPIVPEVASCR